MTPANDTNWLTGFKVRITNSSNKVFNNGFQQLQISVSVTPKAGQEVTEEQLNSIRLVILDDDGHYKELEGDLSASNERDERFEYFPGGRSFRKLELESGTFRRKIYVSSTRPAGTHDTLYARISKDDETHYVTGTSRFNSEVLIETVARPRLTREDFTFWGDDTLNVTLDGVAADFDIYHLRFKDQQYRIVDSIADGVASGQAYYSKSIDVTPPPSFSGPIHAHRRRYKTYYHVAFEVGPEASLIYRGTRIAVNKTAGTMNFVRLKLIGEDRPTSLRNSGSRWGLLDQYGNHYQIDMTQKGDGNLLDFTVTS
ncbi:hypothetical protein [Pseudomonas sp. SLFW]|uniref:hypothetical protein n=1 Tax=Pseudomonas sp. SLFW TaxID=2683259 RepID=UPI0014135364|nr:hypothetical protein [Pseudomonas sp. SLFW]NBB11424.1 hypothetical protein [Pseudomonas sp. SLFW]